MQTRTLRTLLKISQVGSFGTAAEELNMTVSAVSMQIKSLENYLNVQLFDRGYRPPRLTPIGRNIAKHAEVIVREEQLLQSACLPSDVLVGKFELGLIMTASVRLLPKLIRHTASSMPSASLRVTTGLTRELTAQVADGRLDAAIVTATPERLRLLRYDTILKERLVFGIPGNAWQLAGDMEALEIPFIHFSPSSGVGEVIARCLRGTFMEHGESIVLDSVEAIMECVNFGIGYTLLPEPDVIRYARNSVTVIGSSDDMMREIALITRKDSISAKHRDALLNLLSGSGLTC